MCRPNGCFELSQSSVGGRASEGGGRRGQRSAASLASEGRGKAATSLCKKRQSGRWGVVPASQHQEILVALASLIRAERCGMAFDIIIEELQR